MAISGTPTAGRLTVALVAAIAWSSLGAVATQTAEPASAATCADTTLASMTMSQRIGQLFMVGLGDDAFNSTIRTAIDSYHFGSVWFARKTSVGTSALRSVSNAVQAHATQSATHGVRFFIAANQEGGYVQALNGSGFSVMPTALTQGTWSTSTLWSKAGEWGRQLRAAGVNLNFAPVADVVPPGTDSQNAPIGQLKREFGHYVSVVSPHAASFIGGMKQASIFTTAKHFPGLGRVTGNTDYTSNVTDSVTTRHDGYIYPFTHAVAVGVQTVMVSLATYKLIDPSHQAVFSSTIVTGMLRGDLGFQGVIMSDSLSAAAVQWLTPGARAIRFLSAGGDMIVVGPTSQAITMAKALATQAANYSTFRTRVNSAALSVLRAKQAKGLLSCT
jgi:beta-N-acetylhexosaminidase